ncbi:protease inhibitor I42 family protein [Chloroflexota bacterium]
MKRFLVTVVASILLVSLVAGCSGEIGATCIIDPEEVISPTVGQEFVIALDSNPTTGYNWEVIHEEDMLSLEKEEYDPDKTEPGLVGTGGTQYYHFKALKTGETIIVVTYKRSWEEEYSEQKVFNVEIK